MHVRNCDGLNILAERLSQERLDYLVQHYSKMRKEAVTLLEWAASIRGRQKAVTS